MITSYLQTTTSSKSPNVVNLMNCNKQDTRLKSLMSLKRLKYTDLDFINDFMHAKMVQVHLREANISGLLMEHFCENSHGLKGNYYFLKEF